MTSRCVRILPFGGGMQTERGGEGPWTRGDPKQKGAESLEGVAIFGAELPSRMTVAAVD